MDAAYAPPRDLVAKIKRRMTQATHVRPAKLRFDQPALSICFDDFPASAAEHGARVLERHGGRGTFYAAAGLAETDGPCGRNFSQSQLAPLIAAGHEIACHTYSHADCAQADVYDTLNDIARNRDAIRAMGVKTELRALAYPYGETSANLKEALPPRFASARGILPGLNVGAVDLAQLGAYPLYNDNLNAAHAALRRAAKRRAWMIAFTHDVSSAPSPLGISIQALDRLVAQARGLGMLIAPVSFVLERARA
jgi:peptidoglycan/xylan/chitin deacetylase (PgdA/CDA1 family)